MVKLDVFYHVYMYIYLLFVFAKEINILASLCSYTDWFKSYLVAKTREIFSPGYAHTKAIKPYEFSNLNLHRRESLRESFR